jgi:hypothetical protein
MRHNVTQCDTLTPLGHRMYSNSLNHQMSVEGTRYLFYFIKALDKKGRRGPSFLAETPLSSQNSDSFELYAQH